VRMRHSISAPVSVRMQIWLSFLSIPPARRLSQATAPFAPVNPSGPAR
jgi:hypothetical protein